MRSGCVFCSSIVYKKLFCELTGLKYTLVSAGQIVYHCFIYSKLSLFCFVSLVDEGLRPCLFYCELKRSKHLRPTSTYPLLFVYYFVFTLNLHYILLSLNGRSSLLFCIFKNEDN